ncbi:MAG: DNA polymerase III subunit gamma/tau [Anaerolineae bacterium]|jgi:DNA polymerase-3 subunit gamma/tau
MAAQALYLKYRPQTFDGVVGQEPITQTLRNALRQRKIRHAYLLTGPRGTGKTSTARLLAKAVNCTAPEDQRPCNQCPTCTAINEGRLLDLIEIDAASNRGIDEIRDIREKVGFRPNEGRFKVYVLDEAHMLTEPAFNALLKTLEEPPPHVIFALVTTDPHKIPATIASRCQRFDFRRLPLQVIIDQLAYIAEQEGVSVSPDALELIARQGTGAMRDAISLLDQLTSYGEAITLDLVQMVLGSTASDEAGKLVTCLTGDDVAGGLDVINRVVADGADPRQFGREVVEYLRGLLLIREGTGTRLLNVTAEQAAEMEALAEQLPAGRLLTAIRLFNEAATDLGRGLQTIPQLPLEMALIESMQSAVPAGAAPTADAPPARPAQEPRTASPQPKPQAKRVAEETASAPAESPARQSKVDGPVDDAAAVPAQSNTPASSGAALDRQRVESCWEDILSSLHAKRQFPTEAALRTSQLADVIDDEIIVIPPSQIILEKLNAPQRMDEIQNALKEVFGSTCRLRLVLSAQYTPRQPADPAPSSRPPAGDAVSQEIPDEISQWAEDHGAEVSLLE